MQQHEEMNWVSVQGVRVVLRGADSQKVLQVVELALPKNERPSSPLPFTPSENTERSD